MTWEAFKSYIFKRKYELKAFAKHDLPPKLVKIAIGGERVFNFIAHYVATVVYAIYWIVTLGKRPDKETLLVLTVPGTFTLYIAFWLFVAYSLVSVFI